MASERVAAPSAASPMCDTFEKFIKRERELTVMQTGDVTSYGLLAFCESTSETAKTVAQACAAVKKEAENFEFEVIAVDKDPKLAEFCKKGGRKAPVGVAICAGAVRKVFDLTSCSRIGEMCRRMVNGEDINEIFGPHYGGDYHLSLYDIFGNKNPKYHIETMKDFTHMIMRIKHEAEEHCAQTCCILFYDDASESQCKAKEKFDALRESMPDVDLPAVKCDKDEQLRRFACSQGRRLPMALTMRDGEVVHVGYCGDMKKYITELKRYLIEGRVEKAFTEYNGEHFRMKLCDQFACSSGLGEINELAMMVAFVKRVKADGHKFRHQRVMAVMYTPEAASDPAVFACRTDFPIQYPTVDFILISGDEKVDPRMADLIKKQCTKVPSALCIEGGRMVMCIPCENTAAFKHKISLWAQGHPAHVAFETETKKAFKAPTGIKNKKPVEVRHCNTTTSFIKMLRALQKETETDKSTCGAILICERKTKVAQEIEEKMEHGIPLPFKAEYGICDVTSDGILKEFVAQSHELPCLYCITNGRLSGVAFVSSVTDFVDVMNRLRGTSADTAKALAERKTKLPAKMKRALANPNELQGRDAPKPINEYGAFLERFGDMFRSRSDERGLGIMVIYRDSDLALEGFPLILSLVPHTYPKIEYATVNVSHDEMLRDVISMDFSGVPGLITFEYGVPYGCHTKSPKDMLEKIHEFVNGEKIGKPLEIGQVFGGAMALPTDKPGQPQLCATRKSRCECYEGAEGFKDMIVKMAVDKKQATEKGCAILYSKTNEESTYLKKLLTTICDDYPSLHVGLCDADNDQYLKALCVEQACELPMMIVFEDTRPVVRYGISDGRDLSEKVERFMSGERACEVFVTPGMGPISATKMIQAVYHLDAELQEHKRCELLTCQGRNVLFMKGSRNAPECKFSRLAIDILDHHNIDYCTEDILLNPRARDELKKYAQWPTFPQLYHNGEFVGGVDIIRALADSGELCDALE